MYFRAVVDEYYFDLSCDDDCVGAAAPVKIRASLRLPSIKIDITTLCSFH
jgi:hypothetical protein